MVKHFWDFTTVSTEGEVLFELIKKVITEHGLKLHDIVGECFDGASNMSAWCSERSSSPNERVFATRSLCSLLRTYPQLGATRHHE